MKRKVIFSVMLLALTSIIAMQSCKKEAPVAYTPLLAAMPSTPSPASATIIAFTGANQAVNLSWAGAATNAITWSVYFGTSSTPPLVSSSVTTNSYTAHIGATGGKYYWQVTTMDANNIPSESPVWNFVVSSQPNAPTTPSPAMSATGVSCTATITWAGTDPEGFALTYDLLLGTAATPTTIAASGLTSASYAISTALSPFTVYYWQIVSHDPYGGKKAGPIWSFTTGALPINTFVGNYSVAEPAEGWSYPISFTMNSTTSIKTTNYWASGWTAIFTLDLTNLTYSMPITTWTSGYSGIESGVINKTTGKMTGEYTIFQNGVAIEQGLHTYTHL